MTRHRPFARTCTLIVVAAAAVSCSGPNDPGGPPPELKVLPRPLTAAEQTVRGSANAFSFALWNRLNAAQPDSNVFVSPLSASFALGMTMNGAATETFDQMRSALQFGATSQDVINTGYASLISLLTSLDPRVTVDIANSIWYRRSFPFNEGFLDTTRTFFGASVRDLDFADVPGSLAIINGWVSDNTNGKIPTILDDIDASAVMFLINAIYFNARWREQFDPAATQDETFRASGGVNQPVRMMHRTGAMGYAESATWQAVDLAYGNAAFSMSVVLPKDGVSVESVAASLTPDVWDALAVSFVSGEVELALPKLKLTYERTLNDELKALGMVVPFVPDGADFTRMSPLGRSLFIWAVKQKAFVDIHEEGTEAAAVTSVEMRTTSAPMIPVVRVDRPYIFVIRERLSGTILFMGKIVHMP